jgi:hypothetical protein
VIGQHKDMFNNGKLVGLNDHEVGKMVCVNINANLQVLSNVLNHHDVWAFSLASDGSIHQGVSFFDMRIRVCVGGRMFNIHLVVIPFYNRHSAVNICKMIYKLFNQLCSSWRHKLLSINMDGENTMTGWKGGFVTLMDKESANEVLCVWCPAHQMDLVIQDTTVMINDDAFTKMTHNFTVHLRQQVNLQLVTSSKCPKDTNCWAHFQGQLQWLLTHHIKLLEWIEQWQHTSSPTVKYWIIACAINPLAKACTVKLQQCNLCLLQQTKYIEQLV